LAVEAGIEVVPVCGPSAVVAALSVSGFDASRFAFAGFWPRGGKEQEEELERLAVWDGPAVFYESPKRIIKTLARLAKADPFMQICLCNDLTKKFERIYRGTPGDVAAQLEANPSAGKGEYTCVARFAPKPTAKEGPPAREALSLEAQLTDIMAKKNCDLKTAAARLHARPPKKTKKEIYAATLRLKGLV
jgi:16S rRNA (cytidine1402-2'-O)-methyltransferase